MTKICNFPIDRGKRCTQPIADDRPNCGRHRCEMSAQQLGQNPTVYKKDDELHVWGGKPDGLYCLIHGDPAHQVLYKLAGEVPPCCLIEEARWRDKHGQMHRDDGPAWIWPDGTQYWCQHGKLHRKDGPAVIWLTGTQAWFWNDKCHRDDGPAMIHADGTRVWRWHDERHREDGPAMIEADGTQHWYWHDKEVTEEEHAKLRVMKIATEHKEL